MCTPGNKCPTESYDETACADEFRYQDEYGAYVCKDCPIGHYCSDTEAFKCAPQDEGKSYYCPGGLTNVGTHDTDSDYAYGQTACPAGTYNFVDGSESDSDCLECPAGSLCEVKPSTNTAAYKIVNCPAGQYCLKGSATSEICKAGYYCPEGTNYPIPCPSGTFST